MGRLPGGYVTFLFTDIEGSTSLFGKLGDRYRALLGDHHARLREAFARHGGVEVRTEGDSFFVAFADAGGAVTACVEAQLALVAGDEPDRSPLRVRMGLHTGYAEPTDEDDYIALAVHQAARVSSAAHGGQILVSDDTATAVGQRDDWSLERVGVFRLKGFDHPTPLFQVLHPKLPAVFPPPAAPVVLRTNLPRLAARMVGRDETLSHVRSLLRQERVLTLVGPGGVGKSTLAVHAADAAAGAFPGGAWFVDLGLVTEPNLVPEATAAALGIVGHGRESPTRALEERLSSDATIVVIDGAEHVAPAVAGLLGHLLPRCPGLTALVASRVPLGLADERALEVFPLPVPAASTSGDAAAMLANPSVQLLRERWQRAATDDIPEPDADDASLLAEITRRVDGIPLALELAGAALASASPSDVLDGLIAASAGAGDETTIAAPLRASLAWSYELLTDDERSCFRRLGAFEGEPTMEAAAAVCGPEERAGLVAERLLHLSDRSLLRLRRADGRIRVQLLDAVRSFARERLGAAGEGASTADRHFDWYVSKAGGEVEEVTRWNPARTRRLEALAPEIEDLRRAISHGVLIGRTTAALALARAAGAACRRTVRLAEGRLCLEAALAAAPNSVDRARGLLELASILDDLADHPAAVAAELEALDEAERASSRVLEGLALARLVTTARRSGIDAYSDADVQAWCSRALVLADELDDDRVTSDVHRAVAFIADARGDYASQRDHNAKVLDVARRSGDGAAICASAINLASALQRVGELAEAEARMTEALEASTVAERGDMHGQLLAMLAFMAFSRGALDEAWTRAQEAVDVARDHGVRWVTAYALNQLGEVALARGDFLPAVHAYGEALAMAPDAERTMYCLDGLAAIAVAVGDDVAAVMAHSALDRVGLEASFRLPDDYRNPGQAILLAARDRLGDHAFDTAWHAGRQTPVAEAGGILTRRVTDAVARAAAV